MPGAGPDRCPFNTLTCANTAKKHFEKSLNSHYDAAATLQNQFSFNPETTDVCKATYTDLNTKQSARPFVSLEVSNKEASVCLDPFVNNQRLNASNTVSIALQFCRYLSLSLKSALTVFSDVLTLP